MKRVNVLMKATARPRGGKQLLEGEQYPLPPEIAERLVKQGKAEVVSEQPKPKRRKPRQAVQPQPAANPV